MRKTFVRSLLITAVVQFIVTRTRAGQAYEEGAAERMWMLYPINVLLSALFWTVAIRTSARALRVVRGG
ncbi:MAG: hypothetical protein WEC75_12730 [Dehalococcoidia bacterium]